MDQPNKYIMVKAGASEADLLREEVNALWEIVETLPVDTHDMGVHFWCNPEHCWALQEEENGG